MNWWKKFPWKRLFALLVIAVVLVVLNQPVEGKKMYVAIDGGGDNVLLDSDSPWAEGIADLKANQEVEVDEDSLKGDSTFVKAKVKVRGRTLEGWIKRAVLSDEKVQVDPKTGQSLGASAAGETGKGLNSEIEGELREGDPKFDAAITKVERIEAARNKLLGGDETEPDAKQFREHYREFGQNGKLIN
jgi:hypothetical protein